uniref:Uncharacterized protein n=1 Tax=mine drainage metagenome TaxID=410659 RepID=E6QX26_9ZZZZ
MLSQKKDLGCYALSLLLFSLVAGSGIEPPTRGFSMGFSSKMAPQLYATSLINKQLIAVKRSQPHSYALNFRCQ